MRESRVFNAGYFDTHRLDQAIDEYGWFIQFMPHYVALDTLADKFDVPYKVLDQRVAERYPSRVEAARRARLEDLYGLGVAAYVPPGRVFQKVGV